MEKREIPAKHIYSMVTMLELDRIGSFDFAISSLYYLAAWSENKVDSTPNGPVWHDEDAHAEYLRLAGQEFVEGEVEDPPALTA